MFDQIFKDGRLNNRFCKVRRASSLGRYLPVIALKQSYQSINVGFNMGAFPSLDLLKYELNQLILIFEELAFNKKGSRLLNDLRVHELAAEEPLHDLGDPANQLLDF